MPIFTDLKVITKSMIDEDKLDASYDIGLFFVVRTMLSRKTEVVAAGQYSQFCLTGIKSEILNLHYSYSVSSRIFAFGTCNGSS